MSVYYHIIFLGSMIILILGLIEIALIRFLRRDWWHRRWIKRAAIGLPIAGVVCIILWSVGTVRDIRWVLAIGATGTSLTFVLEIALMCSLPFSGALGLLGRLLDWLHRRNAAKTARPVDEKRRVFLKATAAALPAMSLSAGVAGIARGFGSIQMPVIEMNFPNLPSALDGLKILHLSDLHLGLYQQLAELEEVLLSAEEHAPDLVLITGDIADRLEILPDILRMVDEFNTPHGCFASLGNHEYYRGIMSVRRAFDAGPVPLLVGSHAVVSINGQSLTVAGVDDPRVLGEDDSSFLRVTLAAALDGAPSDGFTVLMSHRPEGLDAAAEVNVPLTLAGHTHGSQLGLFGRSFFEPLMPGRYLWGKYRKDNSQLYTSAGVGHWFPFRLGCPPEAPIITLQRS